MHLKWEYHNEAIAWKDFDARMAELGDNGWEAYAIIDSTDPFTYNMYFRRRRPENEPR